MYNSKIYAILEQFDKYEQNRCRKYIQSPYFNRSEQLVQLYDRLVQEVNADKKSGLEKEALWEMLQPGKPYDDVRFRKYCSDLLKLIEGYLAQEVFEQNSIEKAAHLMEAVENKKIAPLNSTAIRSAKRLASKENFRSAQFYLNRYKIEQNLYHLIEFENKRGDRTNIEDISINLDVFYLAEKLRILCAAITQQAFVSYEYKIHMVKEITNYLTYNDYEEYPPVAIYYQIYLTLSDSDNENHYFQLKSLLNKYAHLFPPTEARDILYMAAQNYCIKKINKGKTVFTEELFKLYESLLDSGLLIEKGELSPWYFKNIVVVALRLGKYSWTEKFIKKYSIHLLESSRENAVTFNLARVYWYQKKHDKVIELLRDVEYDDVAYALGARAILLATYYETDEIEPLYSLMESFRAFLNRHKNIPEKRRKNYKNLIKFTKKLTKIRYGDQDAIKKLRKEIEASEGVADAKWLNEQIAELEGEKEKAAG